MTTIEERSEYLNNPFFTKHLYGDWSPFYRTIAVCSIFCAVIFILNLVLGCCSKHRQYWQDRHTGNRWIASLWTATPHNNPPLDLTELEEVGSFYPKSVSFSVSRISKATKYLTITCSHSNDRLISSIQSQKLPIIVHRRKKPDTVGVHTNKHISIKRNTYSSRSARVTFKFIMYYAVLFPALAFVLALIMGVIIVLLKYGPRICGVRHHAITSDRDWADDQAYDQNISYA